MVSFSLGDSLPPICRLIQHWLLVFSSNYVVLLFFSFFFSVAGLLVAHPVSPSLSLSRLFLFFPAVFIVS